MADSAPVMIWVGECNGKRRMVQPIVARVHRAGRSRTRSGKGGRPLIHPDDLERVVNTYSTHAAAHEPFRVELRVRRHDGAYRWVLNSGTPRITETGEFAGYIGSCIDITDHKDGEIERERLLARERAARAEADAARVAAEHANDVKAQFLAAHVARASHATQCHRGLRRSSGAGHPRSGHRRATRGPGSHPPQSAAPARAHQQRPELRQDRSRPRRVPSHRGRVSTTSSRGCIRWSRRRCSARGLTYEYRQCPPSIDGPGGRREGAAGAAQPAVQRDQVHGTRRPR